MTTCYNEMTTCILTGFKEISAEKTFQRTQNINSYMLFLMAVMNN